MFLLQLESTRQSGEVVIREQAVTNGHDFADEKQAQNFKENVVDIVESPSVIAMKKLLHWKKIKSARDSHPEEIQYHGVQKDESMLEEETLSLPRKEETTEESQVKVNDSENGIDTASNNNKELKIFVVDANGIEHNEKKIVADSELSSNLRKQLSDVSIKILHLYVRTLLYFTKNKLISDTDLLFHSV